MNKLKTENDVKELIDTKDYALLFGDLIGDKKMIGKDDFSNVITVGFLDEKVEENDVKTDEEVWKIGVGLKEGEF